MKYTLMLFLTVSLSGQAYAYGTSVSRVAPPSLDESNTGSMNEKEKIFHTYDNSDTVKTGQSATKRDYRYDSNIKSCRAKSGAWLRTGDRGYAACIEDKQTLKK